MDRFFQIVIYGTLIGLITSCVGCSMFGGGELSDEEFIEVVTDSGCVLKHIDRDDGEVGDIDCFDIVRHSR